MIHVRIDVRIVFVKGIHRLEDVSAAICKATKRKRVVWKDWTIVGVSDESHWLNIVTSLPFSPPDRDPIGFEFGQKRNP